jgi:uncharacterized protein
VHVSEISHTYIADPSEVLRAGQIVKVHVLSADAKTKRIALSIKALTAPPARPGGRGPQQRPAQRQSQASVENKLEQLASRWRTR